MIKSQEFTYSLFFPKENKSYQPSAPPPKSLRRNLFHFHHFSHSHYQYCYGRYSLNPKGTRHTSNVICILTCKFCYVFYVRKTGCALNIRINNHCDFCTINKPGSPVSLHTESHNTNFDLSFLVAIIHVLLPMTSISTRHLWEGTFIHSLSAKINPGLNLQ